MEPNINGWRFTQEDGTRSDVSLIHFFPNDQTPRLRGSPDPPINIDFNGTLETIMGPPVALHSGISFCDQATAKNIFIFKTR